MKRSTDLKNSSVHVLISLILLATVTACAPFKTTLQDYSQDPSLNSGARLEDYENYEDDSSGSDHDHPHIPRQNGRGRQQRHSAPVPQLGCENSGTAPCFPIAGDTYFYNDYGNSRGGGRRKHAGNDLMAAKMTRVVAIDDGVVEVVRHDSPRAGTYLAILHKGGLRSVYMHLNNDSPGTDDGRGQGIAPGVFPQVRVKKGQFIGWVGDSGNAEETAPHVHFELQVARTRPGSRRVVYFPINPYRMLKDAERFKVR